MSKRALVIVPTFNERDNLPPLVAGLLAHPGVDVLVVDDRSPDGTGEVADALASASAGRLAAGSCRWWTSAPREPRARTP